MTLTLTDDYSPRYVGDTSKPLRHQFVDHAGKPHDLTGVVAANMTLRVRNRNTGNTKAGGGTWSIASEEATSGIATYSWVAGDVDTAGLFDIQAGVPFPDGFQHFELKEIEFQTPLTVTP